MDKDECFTPHEMISICFLEFVASLSLQKRRNGSHGVGVTKGAILAFPTLNACVVPSRGPPLWNSHIRCFDRVLVSGPWFARTVVVLHHRRIRLFNPFTTYECTAKVEFLSHPMRNVCSCFFTRIFGRFHGD